MSGIARYPKQVILKAAGAETSSTTSATIVIPEGYTKMHVVLNITAAAGTSPTLDVYIQNAIQFAASSDLIGTRPTGTITFNDLIHFTQATGTGTQYASFIEATGFVAAAQDVALAATSIRAGVIGIRLRSKSVIGGTSPSFTYSVVAELLP